MGTQYEFGTQCKMGTQYEFGTQCKMGTQYELSLTVCDHSVYRYFSEVSTQLID